jgi:hypothetical protein
MILYALRCEFGHEFDGWFRSSDDYDGQAKRHGIECPECGSLSVTKAVMAPNVARTDERGRLPANASVPNMSVPNMPVPMAHPGKGMPTPKQVETYFAAVRKHVEDNFDYVGEKFPEEARKIHYGETDERAIYGEASPTEAKELIEEGIEVAPLPGAKKRRSRARAN